MDEREALAARFEAARPRLQAVGYRMLGSLSEAEDAVQDTWLRLSRTDASQIENLDAWLTRVVARVCLNMLRSRDARGEVSIELRMPDPIVHPVDHVDPEHEALIAEGVGLAMLVVLDSLTPPERLAFVLHDMFGVSFSEIAPIVRRSPTAARQLASRARRRVQQAPAPDTDLERQRDVVDAYFAAARSGDFEGLLAVLDADVVLRSDGGRARPRASVVARGNRAVAGHASGFARLARFVRPVLVNGVAGVVVAPNRRPYAVMGFIVRQRKIVAIDALADPARLACVGLALAEVVP